MGSLKKLYGYYPTSDIFLPVKVDANGKIVISGGLSYIPLDGWISAPYSWLYNSWDSIIRTGEILTQSGAAFYYSVGMRVKLTQSTGGVKYGIITVVSDTALTIFFGTDYTLNNELITLPYYSPVKAPLGFNPDPLKWQVKVTDSTFREQINPVVDQWYNLGSIKITIPMGCWNVYYKATSGVNDGAGGAGGMFMTLSTNNNSETNTDFTVKAAFYPDIVVQLGISIVVTITLDGITDYYFLTKTNTVNMDSLYNLNQGSALLIIANCAYL